MTAKKKKAGKKPAKRKVRIIKTYPSKEELERVTEKILKQYQSAIKNLAQR